MSRLAFACILFAGPVVAAEDPVVAAARARQAALKTLVLEYRQVSRVFLPANARRPATEATATADNRVVIDGPRVRVEDNNPGIGADCTLTIHVYTDDHIKFVHRFADTFKAVGNGDYLLDLTQFDVTVPDGIPRDSVAA